MTYARLSAVYGLSFWDVSAMPIAAITAYLDNIPAVLAERRLVAADGALVPWSKTPHKTLKIWRQLAYGDAARARPASPGMLMLIGIGVRRVGNSSKPG